MIPSGDETPLASSSTPSPFPAGDRSNASADPAPGPSARGLLLLAVFLTGATSLAYEIAWTRGLVLVLGSTAATTTVVLAVFVGALGLGARWGGPKADRSRAPLGLYGLLELLAAGWAVFALALAGLLLAPYAALAGALPEVLRTALRVLVAAVVVAPGAFLLGATLPALVRTWVGGGGGTGQGTAVVYGVNTLGAVLGALVSGFYGIERLGVMGWLFLAAGVAGAVGVAALVASRPGGAAQASGPPPVPRPVSMPLRPALMAAAFCGAMGLGIEVAGFRILVFFVEGFTATFAAMLGVFILGLGLGSLVLGPWLARARRPNVPLGLLLLATGASVWVTVDVLLPDLETWLRTVRQTVYASARDEGDIQAALQVTALAGSAVLFLVPAILLGSTFALCVRWAELAGETAGRAVGRVYLWNSLGTVVAPFLVGFWIVPTAGPTSAFLLLAIACGLGALNVACSVAVWRRTRWVGTLMWTLILLILVLGPLDMRHDGLTDELVGQSHVLRGRAHRTLVEVRCDELTTASVVEESGGERILYTDDFAAAATGRHYRYMRMLGHLPVLLAKDPKHAMVIAFGTGTTAGAVAEHEVVERIEVVEVSSAVLELAHHFEEANRRVLDDPRTVVIEDDGRNALLLHDADLDVITLEPLMPYSPAGLPFYTEEFYELARDRLRDGGVLCQWVPVHAMPAGLYAALVRTFFEVFPEGQLWFFEQSTALIAVKGEGVSREAFEARARAVAGDLDAAGFTTPDLVLSGYVASGEKVLLSPVPPSPWTGRTVTDLDPFPEFHPTPRASLNTSYLKDTLSYLATLVRTEDVSPLTVPDDRDAPARRQGTAEALGGRTAEAWAEWNEIASRGLPRGSEQRAALRGQAAAAWQAAARWYGQATVHLPGETVLVWRRARAHRRAMELEVADLLARARQARKAGTGEEKDLLRAALGLAQTAVDRDDGELHPGEWTRAQCWVAVVLAHMGRCDSAVSVLREAEIGAPLHSPQGRQVFETQQALARHRAGASSGLLAGAPPCRPEGAALVATPLLRWRELASTELATPRGLRLAADNLVEAARREGVESDVAELLREGDEITDDVALAVEAGMLVALDPEDGTLGGLLREGSRAAIEEAGRKRVLRRWPEAAKRLASDADAAQREAFAEAAGRDGDRALLRLVVPLLLDASRGVRATTAAALWKHVPDAINEYDPDAPESRRKAAVEGIREALAD